MQAPLSSKRVGWKRMAGYKKLLLGISLLRILTYSFIYTLVNVITGAHEGDLMLRSAKPLDQDEFLRYCEFHCVSCLILSFIGTFHSL